MAAIHVDTAGLTAVAVDLGRVAPVLSGAAGAARALPALAQPEATASRAGLGTVLAAVCDAGEQDVSLVAGKVREAASVYALVDRLFAGLSR